MGDKEEASAAAAGESATATPTVSEAVEAIYTYQASADGELSFEKGDVFVFLHLGTKGWAKGRRNDEVGWFPSAYTKKVPLDRLTKTERDAIEKEGGGKVPRLTAVTQPGRASPKIERRDGEKPKPNLGGLGGMNLSLGGVGHAQTSDIGESETELTTPRNPGPLVAARAEGTERSHGTGRILHHSPRVPGDASSPSSAVSSRRQHITGPERRGTGERRLAPSSTATRRQQGRSPPTYGSSPSAGGVRRKGSTGLRQGPASASGSRGVPKLGLGGARTSANDSPRGVTLTTPRNPGPVVSGAARDRDLHDDSPQSGESNDSGDFERIRGVARDRDVARKSDGLPANPKAGEADPKWRRDLVETDKANPRSSEDIMRLYGVKHERPQATPPKPRGGSPPPGGDVGSPPAPLRGRVEEPTRSNSSLRRRGHSPSPERPTTEVQ